MKRYSPLVLLMFFVVGCSPICDTSQNSSQWHNCSGMDIERGNGTYIGEYKHGVRHGKGEFEFISGSKYVGEWKNNKFHGYGTFTFASGSKYVGEYKDDKRHGQGTYTYANGDTYVGENKDNKAHGYGTYTYLNGQEFKGLWENGEFKGKK